MSTVSTLLGLVERAHDAVDDMHDAAGMILSTSASMPRPGPSVTIHHSATLIGEHHAVASEALAKLRDLLGPTDDATPGECPTVRWCERAGEHRTHRRGVHTVQLGTDQYIEVGIAAVGEEAPWVQLGHVITVGTALPAGMVRLTMTQARELGGALVDTAKRFG